MAKSTIDRGSFRDPAGHVHLRGQRVFRTVMPQAVEDFEFVRGTGLVTALISEHRLIDETRVDADVLGAAEPGAALVLEHPRLPFISYPYEWSFAALKAAALLHLDIHLKAIDHDVTLTDASAYNIQFQGPHPIFIDSLSFRRYQPGEYWLGHRQFCEQFLNPLLLRALFGVPHNAWYRGALEGIGTEQLNALLKWRHKLSWNLLTHVVLQARFQAAKNATHDAERQVKRKPLSRLAYQHMLRGLRKWIAKLQPADSGPTVWSDYAQDNSYDSNEARAKAEFVAEFARTVRPRLLWDIGCNTGDYTRAALNNGAHSVIGFDFDQGALDQAFTRAHAEALDFLPLFLDAANQSPTQGWAQSERAGFAERSSADGVLALAVVHHLAIARNIPLHGVIDWLIDLAPEGVIEFVQKTDPMVEALLRLRDDIFEDYTEQSFMQHVQRRADIVKSQAISNTQRTLIWYRRR